MTDTEFGTRCNQLGVEKGRIQVALEIADWVTLHPANLTSPEILEFVKNLLEKCRQIIQTAAQPLA